MPESSPTAAQIEPFPPARAPAPSLEKDAHGSAPRSPFGAGCVPVDASLIARLPLFSHLAPASIDHVRRHARQERFRAGAIVMTAGAPVGDLFLLLSGKAERVLGVPGSKEIVSDLVLPGEHFGEAPIIDHARQRDTVRCIKWCEVLRVDRAVLAHDNLLAFKILCGLCQQVRRAQDLIRLLTLPTIHARLLGRLQWLEAREASSLDPSLNMTRQELANWVGASREAVSRAISDIEQQRQAPFARVWKASKPRKVDDLG